MKVFNMGIEGAAYATILSQGISFLLGVLYSAKKKIIPYTLPSLPKFEEVRLILKLGLPAGLQMTVIAGGVTAIMSVVNSFGSDVVAGFGAAQRLDSLIMLPAMALGTAVNSMAGQNIGAKEWARVHKIAIYGSLYNVLIMILIGTILFFFAEYGIRLFINEPNAVRFGREYLETIAFLYPFLGLNFILNGVVRGAGAMYAVLALNVISFWVLRYPLTYYFSSVFGEKGIPIGMGSGFVIGSLFSLGYYLFGKWKEKEL